MAVDHGVCLSALPCLSAITSLISSLHFSLLLSENFIPVLGFREQIAERTVLGILAISHSHLLPCLIWEYFIFILVVMFLVLPLRLVLKGDTQWNPTYYLQWILMLFGIPLSVTLLYPCRFLNYRDSVPRKGLLLFLVFLTEINDDHAIYLGQTSWTA